MVGSSNQVLGLFIRYFFTQGKGSFFLLFYLTLAGLLMTILILHKM